MCGYDETNLTTRYGGEMSVSISNKSNYVKEGKPTIKSDFISLQTSARNIHDNINLVSNILGLIIRAMMPWFP